MCKYWIRHTKSNSELYLYLPWIFNLSYKTGISVKIYFWICIYVSFCMNSKRLICNEKLEFNFGIKAFWYTKSMKLHYWNYEVKQSCYHLYRTLMVSYRTIFDKVVLFTYLLCYIIHYLSESFILIRQYNYHFSF